MIKASSIIRRPSAWARLTAVVALCLTAVFSAQAQTAKERTKMERQLTRFFEGYTPKGQTLAQPVMLQSLIVNRDKRTVTVTASDAFADQDFTEASTEYIHKKVRKALVKPYSQYTITVKAAGMDIDQLVPGRQSNPDAATGLWGGIDHRGQPWVENASLPYSITQGLQGRHLSLWASHGRYYDAQRGWRWQRPKLFGTTEDLFTQTIVVPYLTPMLENAGAVVFTPRERDWQRAEAIVDNDDPRRGLSYLEVNTKYAWTATGKPGFARHAAPYHDGENPFEAGTARMIKTTQKEKRQSLVSYQPNLPLEGRYAVYVSYQTLPGSVDDALYTVWHKGEKTTFRVNQQMGGGTWVYLGTFDFDAGSSEWNRVELSNLSSQRGVITTDAVRFGGGMGNVERGGSVSGLPRCLEGARYYAQWAGMPYSVYGGRQGANDYADDINTRSLMTNRLGGGSCFYPATDGLRVPIELSLAVHSDAGYCPDGQGLTGSLAICTTNFNDGRLDAGISRQASRDLADALLTNLTTDLTYKYGTWNRRFLWDRNYSETRLPGVPSAIIETLSHQNFPDMKLGQDPNFKFVMARSLYKTLLRYMTSQHGQTYVVSPLAPDAPSVCIDGKGHATLRWSPVTDPQEPTSRPTGYIVYTRRGTGGFDNGTLVRQSTKLNLDLEPGVLYSFRVAAVNRGGRSFPSEAVCALYQPKAHKTVAIVDGFHRLASPQVVDDGTQQGFDLDADPGVSLGASPAWCGRQTQFNRSRMGDESELGLGYSDDSLTGLIIAGNNLDNIFAHALALAEAGSYSIVSGSSKAVERGQLDLTRYNAVDWVLGLEREDGYSLGHYKTFTSTARAKLTAYARQGGNILVSGSYLGSDLQTDSERAFLADVLKCQWAGSNAASSDAVSGLGMEASFYRTLNESHYAATHPDNLSPRSGAFAAMRYADGSDAAIAYDGSDRRSMAVGFPLECVKDKGKLGSLIRGIMAFLTK